MPEQDQCKDKLAGNFNVKLVFSVEPDVCYSSNTFNFVCKVRYIILANYVQQQINFIVF